jgi:hypothetical protein
MILRIPEQPTTALSPTGPVLVRAFQIILPVQILIGGRSSQEFPAILDTGHSHNFSMAEQQFRDWVGLALRVRGTVRVNKQMVPLVEADLQLGGVLLRMPEGISVYPANAAFAPRLPLLGLRSLVRNNLRVEIHGTSVTIN